MRFVLPSWQARSPTSPTGDTRALAKCEHDYSNSIIMFTITIKLVSTNLGEPNPVRSRVSLAGEDAVDVSGNAGIGLSDCPGTIWAECRCGRERSGYDSRELRRPKRQNNLIGDGGIRSGRGRGN